jgi:hypothetical protein
VARVGGFGSGDVNVDGASSHWISPGEVWIGDYAGGSGLVVVQNGGIWNANGNVYVGRASAGIVNISGSTMIVGPGAFLSLGPPGTLTFDGGRIACPAFYNGGGTFNWNSGTLALTGGLVVESGSPFGAVGGDRITAARILEVAGPLTVWTKGGLTLDGGRIVCASIDNSRGGTFNWNSGTLAFSGGLAVNSGSPFGAVGGDGITAGRILEVGGTLAVGSGGALGLSGGQITAGDVENTGTMGLDHGTLTATNALTNGGSITVSGAQIAAGGLINQGSMSISNADISAGVLMNGGTMSVTGGQTTAPTLINFGSLAISHGSVATAGLMNPGTIDVVDSLVVQATADPQGLNAVIVDQIKLARGAAGGAWTGPGITSLAAVGKSYEGVGAFLNDRGDGTPIMPTFDGRNVDASSILVKHTWNGDANLDGIVNADDYFLADSGYVTQKGSWYNGDFNYDGTVNADDYFLIDSAFIGQTAALSNASRITHHLSPIPEPSSLLWAVGTLALLRRRRCT